MKERLFIAVCEDRPKDSKLLVRLIKENAAAVGTDVFESGEAFLEDYIKGRYHLIFIDVYMNGMSGMDVAKILRDQGDGVPIAFTTSSLDHSLEANRYRSILYITKPVTAEAVAHTLSIADAIRQRRKAEVLTVHGLERKTVDLSFEDIVYIEVMDHRCTVHLISGKHIDVKTGTTINKLDALLPKPQFFRSQQSYIVNLDYVEDIDREMLFLTMKNGGKAYLKQRGGVKKYEEAIKLWVAEKTRRQGA